MPEACKVGTELGVDMSFARVAGVALERKVGTELQKLTQSDLRCRERQSRHRIDKGRDEKQKGFEESLCQGSQLRVLDRS